VNALEELRPTRKQYIMDMVADAGLDVSDWGNFKGGPSKARANPKYCYEWAFVDAGKAVVVTLWFASLAQTMDGVIEQHFNLKMAKLVEKSAVRKSRRERLLGALVGAFRDSLPIRVIVVDGKQGELGKTTSIVNMRKLDTVPWAVSNISEAGEIVLQRGVAAAKLVDQFSLDETVGSSDPKKKQVSGSAFERDPAVRRAALLRAMGLCEYCKKPGFKMANGAIYLETHHVVPLSEKGPDRVWNVAALCPNHHREAHYGATRNAMRAHLAHLLVPAAPQH
jgi:5-methylcytosine-specific restriction protein A